MFRRCCSLAMFSSLLFALAASGGCTTCQSCDDYCGSYYGGRTGDWVHESGRAGSIHTHRIVADGDGEGTMVYPPADDYYP